ncbi:hypothetical protein, partial [Pantoea agglomerans]|uniref:hypothetical protein n=1 Tax=Enterobacter agglomerans TaxID=549 RepID=UPI002B1E5CBD
MKKKLPYCKACSIPLSKQNEEHDCDREIKSTAQDFANSIKDDRPAIIAWARIEIEAYEQLIRIL